MSIQINNSPSRVHVYPNDIVRVATKESSFYCKRNLKVWPLKWTVLTTMTLFELLLWYSKCQSPTTVSLKTSLTRTITLDKQPEFFFLPIGHLHDGVIWLDYQNAFRCNLCYVDLCHARAILHKRKNTEYNSLPQSIMVVLVKWRHHANDVITQMTSSHKCPIGLKLAVKDLSYFFPRSAKWNH